jgi:hypothetical protein
MCDCNLCQRDAAFRVQVEQLPMEQRAYFESMYEQLQNVEMDLSYCCAVMDGSWPNADEVLQHMRTGRTAKPTAGALGSNSADAPSASHLCSKTSESAERT